MAHPIDLLVHRRFFFNISVGPWHVSFWLVVVVVGDEIFDCVAWEKLFHLTVELCRQYFVWGQDNGWALNFLDYMRHRKGFARAGDAE